MEKNRATHHIIETAFLISKLVVVLGSVNNILFICDVLRDLVRFFKKNVKNTHGGVLLLVKLQAKT